MMTRRQRLLALLPTYLFIGTLMVIPLAIIIVISFMEQNVFGGVYRNFSLNAYEQIIFERDLDDSLIFNFGYILIMLRSLVLAFVAAVLCLIVGFPVAYFIAQQPESRRNLLVFLVTIPFWTNMLVRAFAWIIILGRGGVLDGVFLKLGLIDDSLGLLYTNSAILIGLVYTYLPLMILPIYATLEKLDFRLLEASTDLYATKWESLRDIVIPLAKPGIVAGCILVFVPALGDFISPTLLGGAKQMTLGSLVQFQFAVARNWPFGAAFAVVLLIFVALSMAFYMRATRRFTSAVERSK